MPSQKRRGARRPSWVRRLQWLYASHGKRPGKLIPEKTIAEWDDLASFMLLARLVLDSRATEPTRIMCEERILRDARRLAAVGFFELFAVRPTPLRVMLEGEGVIHRC